MLGFFKPAAANKSTTCSEATALETIWRTLHTEKVLELVKNTGKIIFKIAGNIQYLGGSHGKYIKY